MATNILSVSIPKELANFLEECPDISPSKVLQARLFEIKEQEERLKVRLKATETRVFNLSGKLHRVLEWCEDNKISIPENVLG